ncbi:MAG: response regulator transcription factor [Acutalibacteraceae bacterium]
MAEILIVEDEENISNLIRMSLTQAGYQCRCVYDGAEAADLIENNTFDLILLDIMLPSVSGFELMEYIRNFNIPVIFLTAKNNVQDKVRGLRLGAEDYLTKPFDIAELLVRVEVVLRRYHKNDIKIQIGNILIDTESRVVTKDGQQVDLTLKEFEILMLFLKNKNIALYKETIYERVWGDSYMGDTRTVDLHVQRLRKKLDWKDKIQTVYKVGYRYEEK